MADIITTVISANPVRHGSSVTTYGGVSPSGFNYERSFVTALPTIASVSGRYDSWGTGLRYYTGDSFT